MGVHQTMKFLHSKGSHRQNEKTTHGMGEHIIDISDEGLISKISKELRKLDTRKTINPI